MILTADEVVQSLKGSLRLIRREPEGFRAFDVSIAGFWRSFAAILLTAPAFVALLAEQRLQAGLAVAGSGLLDDTGLVIRVAIVYLASWVVFPVVMIGFARLMSLERHYVGYMIAYNWSSVIAAFVVAFPATLHVLGLATGPLAVFYTAAFGFVVVQYRWFLARTALGITGALATLIVALDLTIDLGLGAVARALAG